MLTLFIVNEKIGYNIINNRNVVQKTEFSVRRRRKLDSRGSSVKR